MDQFSNLTLEIFTKLEHQWLSNHTITTKKTRVLTIDGGGGGGGCFTTAAAALIHLENHIQLKTGNSDSRIIDYFDIIAGTGTGALLAVMLNADDGTGNGRPLFTATQAVNFLNENLTKIYKVKKNGFIRRKTRFSGESMENVMKKALTRCVDGKVMTLSDTCKPMIVPCYDLNTHAPFVFSRADAVENASFEFELWKICRATASDPSVLKPFKMTSVDGKTLCHAIDGGLVMNNPTAAVVTHVLHNKRDFPLVNGVEDLLVLSYGNGNGNGGLVRKVDKSGYCDSRFVFGVVCDGVSETVDQMLGNAFCWNHADYVRIQANGSSKGGVGPTMEEVLTERGVESLPFGGKRLLTETNGQRIENFVQRLVASGTSSLPPSPCKPPAKMTKEDALSSFYMSVVYVLNTPIPDDGDDATVEQIRRRNKWENNDYVSWYHSQWYV
uniref:Patatin n=1 Tax=Tanacetum cinerariifolium TaxID=118510 RepID=A0A6L2MNR2_TANCI|nr:probable inactive patatin-like protein 9 [Tanacetum cinerariifolium]